MLQLNKVIGTLNDLLQQYSILLQKQSIINLNKMLQTRLRLVCQSTRLLRKNISSFNENEKEQLLRMLLNRHGETFHKPNSKLPYSTTVVECSINTVVDDTPILQKVYPYPAAKTNRLKNWRDTTT